MHFRDLLWFEFSFPHRHGNASANHQRQDEAVPDQEYTRNDHECIR